jgi:hypothetical protein
MHDWWDSPIAAQSHGSSTNARLTCLDNRTLDSHKEALSKFETYRVLFDHTLLPELRRYHELHTEVQNLPIPFLAKSFQHCCSAAVSQWANSCVLRAELQARRWRLTLPSDACPGGNEAGERAPGE